MGKLGIILDRVPNLATKTSEWLYFVAGVGCLVMAPYFTVRVVLDWSQATLPPLAHGAVLAVFLFVLAFWAWMISGDRGSQLFTALYGHGIKWPFLFSVALLLFAVLCFASLSSTLSDLGYARFEPAVPRGEFWRLQDFYLWHFLDSVPGVKIPETLLWQEPYKYKNLLSGVLLLAFKLAVIIPVIGSFSVWIRLSNEGNRYHTHRDRSA